MDSKEMRAHLASRASSGQPFWGCIVSGKGDVARAGRQGASWVTVSHAGALDRKMPASAIGLLPYADANAEVLARRFLADGAGLPVFAGVFASDQFSTLETLLSALRRAGFAGVQNFPSVGLAEGTFDAFLRETGMDYEREIEMAKIARGMDFFVSALVFTPGQAEAMAAAGADMLVFHPGVNADGEYRGRTAGTLARFADIAAAARKCSPGILLARMAFEREDFPVASDEVPHGIQYDRTVE
jgi:predicted TIM-barrel enzyme